MSTKIAATYFALRPSVSDQDLILLIEFLALFIFLVVYIVIFLVIIFSEFEEIK